MSKLITLNNYGFGVGPAYSPIVLLGRHPAHKANRLTTEGVKAAKDAGAALKQAGIEQIDSVFCSPQPRTVEMAVRMLQGLGNHQTTFSVDERVGSLAETPLAPRTDELVARAKAQGVKIDDLLLQSEEDGIVLPLQQGGNDGAELVCDLLDEKNHGKVFLVASHGASRIEWIISSLLRLAHPRELGYRFAECDFAAIVPTIDGAFNIQHLGQLKPAAVSVAADN